MVNHALGTTMSLPPFPSTTGPACSALTSCLALRHCDVGATALAWIAGSRGGAELVASDAVGPRIRRFSIQPLSSFAGNGSAWPGR